MARDKARKTQTPTTKATPATGRPSAEPGATADGSPEPGATADGSPEPGPSATKAEA